MTNAPKFSHRHNPDGSVDSICHKCFMTVATERSELLLFPKERRHTCEPGLMEHYQTASRARGTVDTILARAD